MLGWRHVLAKVVPGEAESGGRVQRAPFDGRPKPKHVIPELVQQQSITFRLLRSSKRRTARKKPKAYNLLRAALDLLTEASTSSSQTQPRTSVERASPIISAHGAEIDKSAPVVLDGHQLVGKHVHLHMVRAVHLSESQCHQHFAKPMARSAEFCRSLLTPSWRQGCAARHRWTRQRCQSGTGRPGEPQSHSGDCGGSGD